MTDSQCMLNIVAMKTLRKNAMMNMAQIGLIQMTLPISLPIIQCMSNIVATRNVQRLHILETTNGELGFRKFLTDLELTVGWNARSDWFHGELHYVFYNLCIDTSSSHHHRQIEYISTLSLLRYDTIRYDAVDLSPLNS